METRKRSPVLAVLLSVFVPGLGHMYCGQLRRGVICYSVFFIVPFLICLTGVHHDFYGVVALVGIVICLLLIIIGDAFFVSRRINETKLRPYNRWWVYVLLIILNIVGTELIKEEYTGLKAYKFPSGAMVPTLLVGDYITVDLKCYRTTKPERGDIIVFPYPLDPSKDFIKRVVGVEGDTISLKGTNLYVNGELYAEPYARYVDEQASDAMPRKDFGPVTVPENSLLVMGDNRDRSYDGRYWDRFVPVDEVIGKALIIYWAKDKDRLGKKIE